MYIYVDDIFFYNFCCSAASDVNSEGYRQTGPYLSRIPDFPFRFCWF